MAHRWEIVSRDDIDSIEDHLAANLQKCQVIKKRGGEQYIRAKNLKGAIKGLAAISKFLDTAVMQIYFASLPDKKVRKKDE